MALLSDGWYEQLLNEVVQAVAPNILVQFLFLPDHGTSLYNNLSTWLRFVQLQSNFLQLLTICSRQVIYLTIWNSCLEFAF